jgi:hypothetical protein
VSNDVAYTESKALTILYVPLCKVYLRARVPPEASAFVPFVGAVPAPEGVISSLNTNAIASVDKAPPAEPVAPTIFSIVPVAAPAPGVSALPIFVNMIYLMN